MRVDSERFGFRSGYSAGPVPFVVSFQHYDEDVSDLSRPTHFTEDLLSFTANSLRRAGKSSTQLTYNFNSYQRDDDGFSHQSGLNQNLSVFDSENFGAGDWIYPVIAPQLQLGDGNRAAIRQAAVSGAT